MKVNLINDTKGQMAVELAVLMPIIIVCALIIYNLACFSEACAKFDRLALDAIIAHGVSPAAASSIHPADEIESEINDAMDLKSCSVRVEETSIMEKTVSGGSRITFPVSPLLSRFTCTLTYRIWPFDFTIAYAHLRSPLVLTHSRSLVVDKFKAGVVI